MKILKIGIVLLFMSCSISDDHKSIIPIKVVPFKHYLTEYTEDNGTLYNFIYENDKLQVHNHYLSNGLRTFVYKYDSAGQPCEIDVTQPLYNYKLYPVFSDSVLIELKMFIDNQFKRRYIFDYDQEGRVIRVSRISLRTGIIASTSMIWEGQNIKEYELRLYDYTPPLVFKYQFTYDTQLNPYRIVFREFNFNFIDFLPISENNWISMVTFNTEYPQNTLTRKNIFAYSGPGFPFVKLESSVNSDGEKSEIYSEYKY